MDIKDKRTSPVIDQPLELGPSNGDEIIVAGHHESETGSALPTLWLLWHRRGLLGRFALWGLIAATLFAFLIPKRYESTARLMPPDSDSMGKLALLASGAGSGASALGLTGLASNLLGVKNTGALFIGVLGSRTVQDRLIDRFDLRKVYWVPRYEDARKRLKERTDLEEDRKSGVITITVTDTDPARAREMAQSYVNELNKLVAEVSTSSARRERIFLEGRLREVEQDLGRSEKEFSQFSSKNTTLDLREQGKAMLNAAAELEGQLVAAQAQLTGLEQVYTSNNIRVRTLQARIAELRRQLNRLAGAKGGTDPAATSTDPSALPVPPIRDLPLLGVQYADLYRRVRVQETVFEVLTKQYELAKVEEAKEIPTVKVLDRPNFPEKKSFPPRLVIMVIGLLLAFAAGTTWIIGTERWTQLSPEDPTKMFLLEVLSTVEKNVSWKAFRERNRRQHLE